MMHVRQPTFWILYYALVSRAVLESPLQLFLLLSLQPFWLLREQLPLLLFAFRLDNFPTTHFLLLSYKFCKTSPPRELWQDQVHPGKNRCRTCYTPNYMIRSCFALLFSPHFLPITQNCQRNFFI